MPFGLSVLEDVWADGFDVSHKSLGFSLAAEDEVEVVAADVECLGALRHRGIGRELLDLLLSLHFCVTFFGGFR